MFGVDFGASSGQANGGQTAAANGIWGILGAAANAVNGGPSPSGTQNGSTGSDTSLGTSTDTWYNTLLNVANASVPIWTAAVAKTQQSNQLSNPLFAGIGTAPGLTSGAGPVAPGAQAPGATLAQPGFKFSPQMLAVIAAVAIGVYFLAK